MSQAPDEIKAEMSKNFADFAASARRLRRTFKGLEQVAANFVGHPGEALHRSLCGAIWVKWS
jgi:hypothetical protein